MRNLRKLFLHLALAGFTAGAAIAQTNVTAAADTIRLAGAPISTGTLVLVPVDGSGKGIPVTYASGISVPPFAQPKVGTPLGFTCSISNGAVIGSCLVPDSSTSSPSGFAYNITFVDTSTGGATSGKYGTLSQVHGVTGVNWGLDHYAPTSSIQTAGAFTYTQGAGAPSGTFGPFSFYADVTNPATPVLYTNVSGTMVRISGSGVDSSAFDIAGSATKSVATYVVGPSNGVQKLYATTACTGAGDEACINTAIASCPSSLSTGPNPAGCRVVLQNGIFNTLGSVYIDADIVTLDAVSRPMFGGFIHAAPCSVGSPCAGLSTGGAQLRAGASGFDVIVIRDTNAAGTGNDTTRHRGITIRNISIACYNYTQSGISGGNNDDFVVIEDNSIQRCANPINIANLDSPVIRRNNIQDNGSGAGITVGGVHAEFDSNLIFDNNGPCIAANSQAARVVNNVCGDTPGGVTSSAGYVKVIGNDFKNLTGNAVQLQGRGSVIADNTEDLFDVYPSTPTRGNGADVFSCLGAGCSVTGNTCDTFLGQAGACVNISAAAQSVATGNTALGSWNFGGNPFLVGSNAAGANGASFVASGGPAAITSATLQARYTAGSITGVASGSAITTWPDTSGYSGRSLSVFSGGPKYIAASTIHAGPAVRFTASNLDALIEREIQMPSNSAYTIFAVINQQSHSGEEAIVGSKNTSEAFAYIDSGTNSASLYGGLRYVSGSPAITAGSTYVIEFVINGTSSRVSVNGVAVSGSVSATAAWTTGLVVGAEPATNTTVQDYFQGDIADLVVYSGAASTADGGLVGAALCSSYGVTCSMSW